MERQTGMSKNNIQLDRDDLETIKDGLQQLGAPSMKGSRLYELWKNLPIEQILKNQEDAKDNKKLRKDVVKYGRVYLQLKKRIKELKQKIKTNSSETHELRLSDKWTLQEFEKLTEKNK